MTDRRVPRPVEIRILIGTHKIAGRCEHSLSAGSRNHQDSTPKTRVATAIAADPAGKRAKVAGDWKPGCWATFRDLSYAMNQAWL
jgi:hypothetical protein